MEKYIETYELILPQGSIKGAKRETIYGDLYFSFEGIPYAKPPIGELRFKAPQAAESWSKTLDCTMWRSKPKQSNLFSYQIEGSEDCLYINVYAKNLKSDKPLPVMVWIYGGGFYMGEATRERYGPDYIMSKEVVFVAFNYRLCSLGFLSLKDPELGVPGNAGLKDQVLALKWVKKYISYFNGDSENITVFGESAGGASTHYMSLTEQTRGLFHRSITMSGCVLNFWANMSQVDMAYRLAKYHGYTGENIDKNVLDYLRILEPEKLINHTLLNEEERRNGYFFTFGPIVEPYIDKDCVIPKEPFEMLKTAWTNSIPMMIGGTSNEGLYMYKTLKMFPQNMRSFNNDFEQFLPEEVRRKHTSKEISTFIKRIRKLHFGDKDLNENALIDFIDFYTYKSFWHGLLRTILGRLEYAPNTPTYLYRFNFDSPDFNLYRTITCGKNETRGVSHGDDLSYLLYCKEAWKLSKDSEEYKTIERMTSLWTSFAKNGDPNCEIIQPIQWRPLQKSNPYEALNISNKLEIVTLPEKDKLEVWNSLYNKEDLY